MIGNISSHIIDFNNGQSIFRSPYSPINFKSLCVYIYMRNTSLGYATKRIVIYTCHACDITRPIAMYTYILFAELVHYIIQILHH